jgi:hypothetical protein
VVGEKFGDIDTKAAGRREAVKHNIVAHRVLDSLLVSLPDFIMDDFRCGNGDFAPAAFGLPLLDIGSRFGHGLLRFPADGRAAEAEMIGGQQYGSADNGKNDGVGVGGHIFLMKMVKLNYGYGFQVAFAALRLPENLAGRFIRLH